MPSAQASLNDELDALLKKHGAAFSVAAFLREGPVTLDISKNLERAGIVFQIGIVKQQDANAEGTIQPAA